MKKTDAEKLQNEYQKLVEGLREADQAREEDSFMANPGTTPFETDLIYSLARRSPQRGRPREYPKR